MVKIRAKQTYANGRVVIMKLSPAIGYDTNYIDQM